MTQRTNARLAGSLFLIYIAVGIWSMVLFGQATGGAEGAAAKLARIVEHETTVRFTVVLTLITSFCAIGIAVSIWALTRDQDPDLAMLAMGCRLTEGVIAASSAIRTLGLLPVAAAAGAIGPDSATATALGGLLLQQGGLGMPVTATCFAVGSTIYCALFLRARSIPAWMAWLGLLASALLVVALPLQVAGFLRAPLTSYIWIPMALFEVVFGVWLIVKGVALEPARHATPMAA